jgi:hypothetical protein
LGFDTPIPVAPGSKIVCIKNLHRQCPMNMGFVSELVLEPFGQMFPMGFGRKLKQTKLRCRDTDWSYTSTSKQVCFLPLS